MMKFLVLSDLHEAAVAPFLRHADAFDGVLFCGDGASKALPALTAAFNTVYAVRGNCDFSVDLPEEREFTVEGVRVLLTHGHRFRVKYALGFLAEEAHARGCAVAVFGHTHTPVFSSECGVLLCNPGAAGGFSPTFGVLDIRADGILFSVSDREGHIVC